jgi:HEAT repeat protein
MGLKKIGEMQSLALPEQEPEDLAMLEAGLSSSDAELRRMAARDLMAFPSAIRVLGDRLEVEQDPQVLDSILNSLATIASPLAVELILPCLRSGDAFKRNQAIEVLKSLPDVLAPFIEDLLQDPDPDVRIFVVNVLESLRHPKVVGWLINVIHSDTHTNVCATALDLLAEVGDESCLPALDEAAQRFQAEPYLVFTIQMAIERITEHKGSCS